MRAITLLILGLSTALVAPAAAQPGAGHGPRRGHGQGSEAGPRYDAAQEVTFTATVRETAARPCRHGGTGVHLMVDRTGELWDVHLGPSWYFEESEASFEAGDEISVTGAPRPDGGPRELIARSVTQGDQTLVLRDETGRPAWAGRSDGKVAGHGRHGRGNRSPRP